MSDINELTKLIKESKTELCGKIDSLVQKLEVNDKRIAKLENKVSMLEEKLVYDDTKFKLFERLVDDSEQYSRRSGAEESLQKVKDQVAKLGVNLDARDFDRAQE